MMPTDIWTTIRADLSDPLWRWPWILWGATVLAGAAYAGWLTFGRH